MDTVIFIDTEVNPENETVQDYGAAVNKDLGIHTASFPQFQDFLVKNASGLRKFVCGHNIIHHDSKYIREALQAAGIDEMIDTLYLSPLLFPNKPYHRLLKDDKLQVDELNNPLNDSIKAMELFYDEVNAFGALKELQKDVYAALLGEVEEFRGFFSYLGFRPQGNAVDLIKTLYYGKICSRADVQSLANGHPVELAYVLSMLSAEDTTSLVPPWVLMNFPAIPLVIKKLRNTKCAEGCTYCRSELSIHKKLKTIFGYDDFRTYNGEKLQEMAAQAAIDQKSLLAVFPTGGGKSITFQLPALMEGNISRGLTVVISPLLSLMKDQVDNLEERGIVDAVTINGMLSSVERAEAIERVENGMATILYIAPESLRSATVERMLLKRNVVRFVIDEAHCFSAWGQDFRVDYFYIGPFIRELQKKKQMTGHIPVSCFTATAKQKVISDIKEYFKETLDLDLELFTTDASRKNLRYEVWYKETEDEKYEALRWLIEQKNCPTIVYVSRTKRTLELAEKLTKDGFPALAYNGKMDQTVKQENQDAFKKDEVKIMVATSAFGMGVDKANIKLVIHYEISDSLENYVQEAGRAGRDPALQAECYVLFNEDDLDKHFILLNQTKVSISEIQQVWKAVKDLTRHRPSVQKSAVEIARQAGWDENNTSDVETRVKTALLALEKAGYITRGKNIAKVFASGILVNNLLNIPPQLQQSERLSDKDKETVKRILAKLIAKRSRSKAGTDEAESRVDYIAESLGLESEEAFRLIHIMREEKILADSKDMTAYILKSDSKNKSLHVLKRYAQLEEFLLRQLSPEGQCFNLKELNENAIENGIKSATVKNIKTIFYFWTIQKYIQKSMENSTARTILVPTMKPEDIWKQREKCIQVADFIVRYLFEAAGGKKEKDEQVMVEFSFLELGTEYKKSTGKPIHDQDLRDALLYLTKIGAMEIEGDFLVSYNGMQITRLQLDNKIRYKADDYKSLNEYYKQKIQQIHIVGEFARIMVRNYEEALGFVNDYFQMEYPLFLAKYFKGNRKNEINRNITPEKYNTLFRDLSEVQRSIIDDDKTRYIVVAAGPGSGKTKVLVHKLASLMLLEDVKHEQLLMVTFSRAATNEFAQRLHKLIGNASGYIEIKTFHSYCFDLIGRIGNLSGAQTVVQEATERIRNGEVELGRITKMVLVIDEAQDMDRKEYELICALIERNDDLRVIAVGDDDQNIYEFRGSDSGYFASFLDRENAKKYELLDNYRSAKKIVAFTNAFTKHLTNRLKTNPMNAIRDEEGTVELIRCKSKNLEDPVATKAAKLLGKGTVCILTMENSEAMRVVGLLKKRGIYAKLIQSNDGFDLYNLIEIRYFLMQTVEQQETPVIAEARWEQAKQNMMRLYEKSSNLPLCLMILETFELTNRKKYRSDFELFLHESKIEDFYQEESGCVMVSTVHKSKGREFDEVVMLLDHAALREAERKRVFYVGMTRAKNGLYLYYNDAETERYFPEKFPVSLDDNRYEKPEEILVQLSHRDVNLGFFMNEERRGIIRKMFGGAGLLVKEDGLETTINGKKRMIVRFSHKFLEEIEKNKKQGYTMSDAKIRFIVGWKDQETGREYPIILPDVYFRRMS